MKRIYILLLSAIALMGGMSSCKVDKLPEGNKLEREWVSVEDFSLFRNTLYVAVRSSESPSLLEVGDYQSDLFNVSTLDGNQVAPFFKWDPATLVNNDMIASYYAAQYSTIMYCNYYLDKAEAYIKKVNEGSDDAARKELNQNMGTVKQYMAEARVLRAQAYYRLMTRFSKKYTGDGLGVPMVLHYDPLNEEARQVERSTQKQVYDFCLAELKESAEDIPSIDEYPSAEKQDGIPYHLVKEYAYAVEARIRLEMGDYEGVISAVDKFKDKFPLLTVNAGNAKDLEPLYTTETASEIMVKCFATYQVGAQGATGAYTRFVWDWNDAETEKQEYLAGFNLLPNSFFFGVYSEDTENPKNDARIAAWFVGLSEKVATNVKRVRNPRMDKDAETRSYLVSTHLFDISEAYLMKAEAQAWSGDAAGAVETLADLRFARGLSRDDFKSTDVNEVKAFVKRERVREMGGDGTRMTDLKRWGDALDRSDKGPQDPSYKYLLVTEENTNFRREADHKMFVWEFPQQEIFANRKLGQTNW